MIIVVVPHDEYTVRCGIAAMGDTVHLMYGVSDKPVCGFGMNETQFCRFWVVPRAKPISFGVIVFNHTHGWHDATSQDLLDLCALCATQ